MTIRASSTFSSPAIALTVPVFVLAVSARRMTAWSGERTRGERTDALSRVTSIRALGKHVARRVLLLCFMATTTTTTTTTTERKERLHTLPTNDAFAAHMHLVLSIVADFMRRVPRSVQREDLVAAGSIGLLHALRSNRHTCPEMLTAYARIRIRGAVIDELRRHDWSPRRRRTNATTQLPGVVISDHNNSGSSRSNAKTSGGTVTIKTDSASNGHGSHGRSYSGEKVEKAGVVVIGFDDLPLTHSLREEGPSPLEEFETRRGASEVRNAVDKLPPRERTIVRMRYFEEVPSKAIASTLGLSEARVSQLLARATLQLKQLLTEREGELDLAA